jgi:hypothetical protein
VRTEFLGLTPQAVSFRRSAAEKEYGVAIHQTVSLRNKKAENRLVATTSSRPSFHRLWDHSTRGEANISEASLATWYSELWPSPAHSRS